MRDLLKDVTQMGLEQYDLGFDDCVALVGRLLAKGATTGQLLALLAQAQRERPDIVDRVVAGASGR